MDEGFSLGKIVFFFLNGNNIESVFFPAIFPFLPFCLSSSPFSSSSFLTGSKQLPFVTIAKGACSEGWGSWWVVGESQVEAKPQFFSEPLTHSGVGFKWYTHTFLWFKKRKKKRREGKHGRALLFPHKTRTVLWQWEAVPWRWLMSNPEVCVVRMSETEIDTYMFPRCCCGLNTVRTQGTLVSLAVICQAVSISHNTLLLAKLLLS